MSQSKKIIRKKFRDDALKRDGYKCKMCGLQPKNISDLDVHHIFDRTLMPNGGYVKENGISLCSECHIKAESTHKGEPIPERFTRKIKVNKAVKGFYKWWLLNEHERTYPLRILDRWHMCDPGTLYITDRYLLDKSTMPVSTERGTSNAYKAFIISNKLTDKIK